MKGVFLRNMDQLNKKAWIVIVLSIVVITLTIFFILPPNNLLAKKLSPFAIHWMLFCFFAGFLCLALSKTNLMYVFFSCTATLAFILMNAYNTDLKLAITSNKKEISVQFINLSLSGDDEPNTIQKLIAQNPDIILIEELTPNWMPLLEIQKLRYPYQVLFPSIDPLGKAILSKFPVVMSDTLLYSGIPVLSASIQNDNKNKIKLVVSNFLPPLTLSSYGKLNLLLDSLSGYLLRQTDPVILAANFNVIPWSKELRTFRDKAKLVASRRDNNEGVVNSNVLGILNAPQNEIYFGKGLDCSLFTVLKDSKNDPFGLLGKYQIK
jgi:endonuclease/exonuclease/phosphatase (EEP) superfamily protein YafD